MSDNSATFMGIIIGVGMCFLIVFYVVVYFHVSGVHEVCGKKGMILSDTQTVNGTMYAQCCTKDLIRDDGGYQMKDRCLYFEVDGR